MIRPATLAVLLAGCASATGVVPTGADTYMIADGSSALGAQGAPILAKLYREANEFCGAKRQTVQTISSESKDHQPFVRTASARLDFRCTANKTPAEK